MPARSTQRDARNSYETNFAFTVRRCPRQDSNLRSRFRKPMLYPLSYGSLQASRDVFGGSAISSTSSAVFRQKASPQFLTAHHHSNMLRDKCRTPRTLPALTMYLGTLARLNQGAI